MDIPDDAIQAGSLRLKLASSQRSARPQERLGEWTDIEDFASATAFAFASPESVPLLDSLVRLRSGHSVGRKPHYPAVIRAFCKLYDDSLVVRVYLLPRIGPFGGWPASVRREIEEVINKLLDRWEWTEDQAVEGKEEEFVFQNKDYRQISALYQTIPSPSPSLPSIRNVGDVIIRQTAQRILGNGDAESEEGGAAAWAFDGNLKALGMITELYGYQRRSVAQMLLQESCPDRFHDIKFVKMKEIGRDGVYFIDLQSGEVRREEDVGVYDLPRGGILCEEMGTGKTIITLSLILATSQQRTLPDPAKPHSPVFTEKGLSTIPQRRRDNDQTRREGVASLVDLALHRHLSYRSGRLPEATLGTELPPLRESFLYTLANDHPFYSETIDVYDRDCLRPSSSRDRQRDYQIKIYLSTASLIIVPRLLLKQWQGEIEKHFRKGALKYITVGNDLPSRDEVLKSDIVLITDARFRAAEKEIHNNAKEGIDFDIFTKIRWKRVILDEGHIARTATGALMTLARKTCSEAFWAVSGTPTKHALSSIAYAEESVPVQTEWTSEGIQDLRHLLGIMTHLLQMKPFDVEGKAVGNSSNTLVVKPLASRDGPSYGAIDRIEGLIHSVMVRTREQDIVAEVVLPPCEERTQSLDLDYFGNLTYNVLQAMFITNAVLSQRVGPDYLLTPSNRSSLLQATRNLQLACCWLPSSTDEINPVATLGVLEAEVGKPEKLAALSEEDRELVWEAERWLRIAADDQHWRKMHPKISIPIRLGLLPADILRAASLSAHLENDISLTTADISLALRASAATITDPESISGNLIKAAQIAKRNQPQLAAAKAKPKSGKKHTEQSVSAESKSRSAAKTLRRSEQAATHERQHDIEDLEALEHIPKPPPKKSKRARRGVPVDIVTQAEQPSLPIPFEVQALELSFNTVSSKLDWVVAETLRNEDDRFLVFAKDSVMLGQLTDSLDLVGVSSCYVGTGSNFKAREAAIELFQQKRRRVCLMEVELAGRGLNLIAANRVIFMEPVWKEDLQRQAIARIYRIGQHRATTCDILYIEGSQEQEVLERRHGSKAQNAEDDDVIQRSIAYPRFLHNIAPPRTPFVVKLLDPSNHRDGASISGTKREFTDTAKIDIGMPQSQKREVHHDGVSKDEPRPAKRARFAADFEGPDTPPPPHDEEEFKEEEIQSAAEILARHDQALLQDSARPRKKAKVTFAPSDDVS